MCSTTKPPILASVFHLFPALYCTFWGSATITKLAWFFFLFTVFPDSRFSDYFSFPIVSQTFIYALWMRYEIKRRLLEHHPCSTVTVDPITEIEWQAGSLHRMNTLDKKKMILISHLEKCGPDGSRFHCIMYSFIFYFLFVHLFNHSVEAFHCTVQTSFFFFHFVSDSFFFSKLWL